MNDKLCDGCLCDVTDYAEIRTREQVFLLCGECCKKFVVQLFGVPNKITVSDVVKFVIQQQER